MLASASFVLGAWCSTAQAQTAAASETADAASQGTASSAADTENVDIIVTAQRRSESVLRVPVSVTVVSGDALRTSGVNDLGTITKLTPSLQIGSDDSFSVRGIGTSTFAPTIESSVSQVLDEVVLGSPTFAANAFYDIERVEVLNGPQGLLFGKNASAGLINISTTRPQFDKYGASFDLEATSRFRPGSDGQGARIRSTLNIPISEDVALRASGTYSTQDAVTQALEVPAGRNDLNLRQYGGRLKLLVNPTSALSIYLIGDYFRSSGLSGFSDSTFRTLGDNSQYPAILAASRITPGPDNLSSASDGEAYRDVELGGAQANISYLLGNGMEISSITAWKAFKQKFQADADLTPANFLNVNLNATKYDQFSQELRLALPATNPLSGQFGLYYFQSHTTNDVLRGGLNGLPAFVASGFPFCVDATVSAGPPPACNVNNEFLLGQDSHLTSTVKSYAAFGQVSYSLFDGFKLTAGGRLTRDEGSVALAENRTPYFVTLGVPDNFTTDRYANTNFSWRVGADFQITPQTLLYGFYGWGYKGPGFSNSSPAAGSRLAVNPEISKGGEVGVKSAMFDRKLTLSVSAFYTRFSDLQVQSFVERLQTNVLSNAATATTKGIDASVQLRPTRELSLSASASVIDAKFNSYPGAQCYTGQPGCVGTSTFNAAGQRVPLSSKFTSTVSADYMHPIIRHTDAIVNLTYYHRSPLTTSFAPQATIPTVDRLDANVGVRSGGMTFSVFCRNCTNQIRPFFIGSDAGDAVNKGTLTTTQRFNYDSVRTIGLRFGFNY
ncbi:TonB-dependent receptor [Sphingomonas populi]|uniref:TonB-dependent receptor n=2 Tax=Sphingomonas populi TaxID=2484750 RepID=A0A4V2DBU8_9SPHN|nr:TonB-dependent receptor [Sphingomonas populi]